MVGRWMKYAGALMLILLGVSFYSRDSSFPPARITTLALLMIIVGLVWAGLALNNLLREQRYRRRSRNGSLRVVPALSARYRGHRDSSWRVPDRRFTAKGLRWPHGAVGKSGIAMNALADVTLPSLVKHTLRMAAKEAKEKLCEARGSMWACSAQSC